MTMPRGPAPPTGPEPASGGAAVDPPDDDAVRALAVLGRSFETAVALAWRTALRRAGTPEPRGSTEMA